jgi:hypothetical protein
MTPEVAARPKDHPRACVLRNVPEQILGRHQTRQIPTARSQPDEARNVWVLRMAPQH